jgi:hypothetical protein
MSLYLQTLIKDNKDEKKLKIFQLIERRKEKN